MKNPAIASGANHGSARRISHDYLDILDIVVKLEFSWMWT